MRQALKRYGYTEAGRNNAMRPLKKLYDFDDLF